MCFQDRSRKPRASRTAWRCTSWRRDYTTTQPLRSRTKTRASSRRRQGPRVPAAAPAPPPGTATAALPTPRPGRNNQRKGGGREQQGKERERGPQDGESRWNETFFQREKDSDRCYRKIRSVLSSQYKGRNCELLKALSSQTAYDLVYI